MFKLANVVIDKTARAVQYPTLYCRADRACAPGDKPTHIKLTDAGTYDFTTYINALSAQKYFTYCSLDNFSLHLEIASGTGVVQLTFADQFSQNTQIFSDATYKFDASEKPAVLDITYPKTNATMVAFRIVAQSATEIKNSFYYTHISASQIKDVRLALCTTTFKKEDYIIPNVKKLYEEILCDEKLSVGGVGENAQAQKTGESSRAHGASESAHVNGTNEAHEIAYAHDAQENSSIAQNFWIHVVDNGRTLSERDFPAHDHILLHPNVNAGGAGGFARGMIEALHQSEGITHVLLMDDDVSVSPESIKRTYNLLRIVNAEYAHALVSGAMLDIDYPNEQWEDAGRIDEFGHFMQAKKPLYINKLTDCVKNELYDLSCADYAAWWYCVMPTSVIREHGLPLPFFVRSDDTEYGFRVHEKIMTMNSIGIWHQGFRTRYDAAVERYQTTRNTLMANAFTGCAKQEYFINQAKDAFKLEIKRFNYKNALLVIEALEDYLRGPEFIMRAGVAEEKFLEKHKTCEQLLPLDEALALVPEEYRDDVTRQINITSAYIDSPRALKQRIFDVASWNGQMRTHERGLPQKEWAVMPYEGWFYLPERQMGAQNIFVIDFIGCRGACRHKDDEQFKELYSRFNKAIKATKGNRRLVRKYRRAAACATSETFWRDYLGMDKA